MIIWEESMRSAPPSPAEVFALEGDCIIVTLTSISNDEEYDQEKFHFGRLYKY